VSGVTILSALLIATPLLHWAYLSLLWYFTILEPPFTTSRGLPLAMQVFFAPGNVIPIVLGVGLLLRSERTRRVARVVFALGLGVAAWLIGLQVATGRVDSNVLVLGLSLAVCGACVWYFGRPQVRVQFATRAAPAARPATPAAAPDAPTSRALVVAASVETMLAVAGAFLLVHLYRLLTTRPLIDMGVDTGGADELLRSFVFAVLALLVAPHLLSAVASVGIVLGRNMTAMARRYASIACWTMVAAALVAAWLATREGLAFDPRAVRLIAAFCAASLIWHACFLYLLAKHRPR
jgi:hypothetical protein